MILPIFALATLLVSGPQQSKAGALPDETPVGNPLVVNAIEGCPGGFVQVPNAEPGYCYKFSDQRMHMPEAMKYCDSLQAYLVRPDTKDQMDAIQQWAKPLRSDLSDPLAGFWMGYNRRPAPEYEGMTPEEMDGLDGVRLNKNLFYDIYSQCPRVIMPNLWRQTQPGNILAPDEPDMRDEKCVARKKMGGDGVKGADDYPCSGHQQHYAICEKCVTEICQWPYIFPCRNSGQCYLFNLRCNGEATCPEGEDEADCPPDLCPQSRCLTGDCVSDAQLCNGPDNVDCATDWTDENPGFCHAWDGLPLP